MSRGMDGYADELAEIDMQCQGCAAEFLFRGVARKAEGFNITV